MTLEIPEGVKAFNLWTLWIMARMWEEFPLPQYFCIDPSLFTVHVATDPRTKGTVIGPSGKEQAEIFAQTLDWLLAEGFVAGKHNGLGVFDNMRLTTKGFAVLNLVPDSLSGKSEQETKLLGAMIREATVKQTVDGGATLIRTMIAMALNAMR
jgi:hypothetical protein